MPIKEEDIGSAAAASQQDRKHSSPEQPEHMDSAPMRPADVAAERSSAKKAKKGSHGSSPPARKKGPMDSFLIKNPI